MPHQLAIDWDDNELRLVAAQTHRDGVKVTDAAVIPLAAGGVHETLRQAIADRGLEKTSVMVAIGRGRAELRELQLPPVPDEELSDIVRFQAIRSFASSGDSAIVDYLVTKRTSEGVQTIAAAVGPTELAEIRKTCEAAQLDIRRVSLRPLASAALYLLRNSSPTSGDVVLIDLLGDDAEIVITRDGNVVFVRTVRMPSQIAGRGKVLAGELRRSLAACGSQQSPNRVVLWGRQSIHASEQSMLAEASESQVDVINPFDLVEVSRRAQNDLPAHTGRLAPLLGLLAADEGAPDRLVDFLNPRQRPEVKPNPVRRFAMIGIPIMATMLIGLMIYRRLDSMDQQIAQLKSANAAKQSSVEKANASIQRTAVVDDYLDGDVNWLAEMQRLAKSMPPSDQMIIRRLAGATDDRRGGGTLTVVGGVTDAEVIDEFERALRDDRHRVVGDGASARESDDAYRFGFTETITMDAESIRHHRYQAIDETAFAEPDSDDPATIGPTTESNDTTTETEP